VLGKPVDRYYIEAFLQQHLSDIKGRVLEVGNSGYTRLFGGDRVTQADAIDLNQYIKNKNHYFDLATGGDAFPQGVFDCFILSQTLSFIFDVELAIKNAYAVLKPGGILLATLPGIGQIYHPEMEQSGDYWRFTNASVQRLFGEVFGNENITVITFGNVLSASAYLFGLESQELKKDELDFNDPDYQITVAVRAVKREDKIPAANVFGKFVSIFGKAKRYLKRN
jgi:SAM-dependent methyltransferase